MSEPTISNLIRNVNVTFITWVRSPGDLSGFQVTGMIEGFFTVGLKFSIPGIFWVRKFEWNFKEFFWGFSKQYEDS